MLTLNYVNKLTLNDVNKLTLNYVQNCIKDQLDN